MFAEFFYFRLLDTVYDLGLWPKMTFTYDPDDDLGLGLYIISLVQNQIW